MEGPMREVIRLVKTQLLAIASYLCGKCEQAPLINDNFIVDQALIKTTW